ncbi:hypothetical protein [Lysobacter sp. CA199]
MLFFREAERRSRRLRAARIVDVNAGFAGEKHAKSLLADLNAGQE